MDALRSTRSKSSSWMPYAPQGVKGTVDDGDDLYLKGLKLSDVKFKL